MYIGLQKKLHLLEWKKLFRGVNKKKDKTRAEDRKVVQTHNSGICADSWTVLALNSLKQWRATLNLSD